MLLSIPPLRAAETSALIRSRRRKLQDHQWHLHLLYLLGNKQVCFKGSNTVTKVLSELREKVVKSCRLPYCSNSRVTCCKPTSAPSHSNYRWLCKQLAFANSFTASTTAANSSRRLEFFCGNLQQLSVSSRNKVRILLQKGRTFPKGFIIF